MWGALNCIFTRREINAFAHEAFNTGCDATYGDETVKTSERFMERLEPSSTLVKAMLMIFAFSSNCSIVTTPCSESLLVMSSSIVLVRVQYVFVTVLWKYLIYPLQISRGCPMVRFVGEMDVRCHASQR